MRIATIELIMTISGTKAGFATLVIFIVFFVIADSIKNF